MNNLNEMKNNDVIIDIKPDDLEEEEARIQHFIARFDKLLMVYEERMKEEFKLEIWNAHVRNEIIAIELRDGDFFVGKTTFALNENYTSLDALKKLFHISFNMANGVPFGYHIGGKTASIFISKIKNVFVMTDPEIENSRNYANMAPEFIKRLFPDVNVEM